MKTQLQFLNPKPQTILHFGKVGWRLLFLKHVVLHCAVPPFLSCSKAGVPNSAPWDQCYGGRDDEKSDGHLDDYTVVMVIMTQMVVGLIQRLPQLDCKRPYEPNCAVPLAWHAM